MMQQQSAQTAARVSHEQMSQQSAQATGGAQTWQGVFASAFGKFGFGQGLSLGSMSIFGILDAGTKAGGMIGNLFGLNPGAVATLTPMANTQQVQQGAEGTGLGVFGW